METYNLVNFIEKCLIPDLHKMINGKLQYYAFTVICQAIEVLGSVYDQKSIEDYGASETRFDNALILFRDKRYREKQNLLFEKLRGPMIHQLRPGEGLFIASSVNDKINEKNHLEKDPASGRVILIIERFMNDFLDAFESFKKVIDKRHDLDRNKVNRNFLTVAPISPKYPTNFWDTATSSTLTITPSVSGR